MTKDQLDQMAQVLEDYLKDKSLSQNECAKRIGIASSYITHALKRNWDAVPSGGNRTTEFSSQVARKIMLFLGMNQDIWEIENFQTVINILAEAKKFHEHRIIEGEKGTGKTFAATEFKKQAPTETYLITCSEDMNPKAFIVELARLMNVDATGDRRKIRIAISERLRKQTYPLIIIDEAENLKIATYGSIKALYDDVKDFAGIVLIGANNYLDTIRKRASSGKSCFPQLYSRFSADPGSLSLMSKKDVAFICALNGLEDKQLVNHLFDTCTDYRELDRNIKRRLRDEQLKVA